MTDENGWHITINLVAFLPQVKIEFELLTITQHICPLTVCGPKTCSEGNY